tara:strand:- start:374 stop:652 length:279 start_codon:yes stop_codon:yes gene_type:complete
MTTLKSLQKEIDQIKARNNKVEANKAWETSWSRKILVAVLTYIVIVVFFLAVDLSNPFVNAIVPTVGFVLSTMSVPIFKQLWVKYCHKKRRR